jgi:hypothetical protein
MASIFREKSLERIQSPEQLEDYIHVSNPSVWMVLGAIVLLLAGLLAWSAVGTIEEKSPAALVVRDGAATCYVAQDRSSDVAPGDAVRVEAAGQDGQSGVIVEACEQPVSTSTLAGAVGQELGQDVFDGAAWAAEYSVSCDMADGVYRVEVVTASYHPFALLLGDA